jgi:outer membrane lipoprotein SlyB
MNRHIVFGLIALASCLPLAYQAGEVQAQPIASAAAEARINGFDVEPVEQALAGNELAFTLYGSPGGTATVRIDGATGGVVLVETEAGIYEGTYTIRKRDRITANSAATVNLRLGNKVVSAILDEPLVGSSFGSVRPVVATSATTPKISRFDVDPPLRLVAGEELILMLSGTPGAMASARIAGVKGKLVMYEIRPGEYEGRYVIQNRDRIASDAVVTANLRIDSRNASAILDQPLSAGSRPRSADRRSIAHCADCGVVEAINVVEVKGNGSYLGTIAGGVAGVLLGSQIGHGAGTTVAQVAGAAGGAYIGNEIEKKVKTTKHYEVVVRLDNGGSKTVSLAAQPGFAVGARVTVANGTVAVIS